MFALPLSAQSRATCS